MEVRDILTAHFKTALAQGGDPDALADELLAALEMFGFEIRRKKPTAETLNATIAIHGKK